MATLIGAMLLLAQSYFAYRAGQRLLGKDNPRDPLADRPGRGWSRVRVADLRPDTPGEVREHELSRRLIAGHIDPAVYRREMGELARIDQSRSGDPR